MKIITLPKRLNKDTIRDIIADFRNYVLNPDDDKLLRVDLREIEFIEPAGVVALNNMLKWVSAEKRGDVEIYFIIYTKEICPPENKSVMEYLSDCNFFANFGKSDIFKTPKLRPTMLKLKFINSSDVFQWKITDLKRWLQQQTGRKNEFSAISIAIDEIFNNISDHSNQKIGSIFGQYYPNKKEIIIVVSDFGVGIPSSIRKKFTDQKLKKDNEVIEFSLEEGVSSKSEPHNRGAGLANIMRTITTNEIGEFTIVSNYGKVRILNNHIVESEHLKESYPGTFFEIRIDTSNENLYDWEEEEEFEW